MSLKELLVILGLGNVWSGHKVDYIQMSDGKEDETDDVPSHAKKVTLMPVSFQGVGVLVLRIF